MRYFHAMLPWQKQTLATGALLSILYAAMYVVAAYFVFRQLREMPTVAFLCLVPGAMGAVPLLFRDPEQTRLYQWILFVPWMAIATAFLLLALTGNEGILCMLVLASPFAAAGLVGTFVGWLTAAILRRSSLERAAGVAMMLLPLAFLPVENRWLVREERITVESSVVVRASASTVWGLLAEFETIQPSEYRDGFFHWAGLPRPIRATVDRPELGGHRTGEFEGGLRFDEVITAFDPPRRMGFSVDVDPTTLRPDSAERHAFESGYFRFLDAGYQLEDVDAEHVRVKLSSTYVVKTSVNAYGKVWANAVIEDFQDRVLTVLQARAERLPPVPAAIAAGR
jgi:hypothetical protein